MFVPTKTILVPVIPVEPAVLPRLDTPPEKLPPPPGAATEIFIPLELSVTVALTAVVPVPANLVVSADGKAFAVMFDVLEVY